MGKNFNKGLAANFSTPLKTESSTQRSPADSTEKKGKYYRQPRATFLVEADKVETLKAIAYWERKKIKDLINEAIDTVIKNRTPEELEKALKEYKKLNTK